MLDNEIEVGENELDRLGIPLPPRPPKSINSPTNTEVLGDELMFRIIYWGIQNFISQQTQSLLAMQNMRLRKIFLKLVRQEIELYSRMTDYAKIKGWLIIPPGYGGQP